MQQPRIFVRRAAPRDLPRILKIEAACFGPDAWDRPIFVEALGGCIELFLVTLLGRRVAGYSVTNIERGIAELVSIAVHPRYRGRGVAQAMLRHTAAELQHHGALNWRLNVRTENSAAIRFYRQFGFHRIRTVRDYYGPGEDAWRMEMRTKSQ